MAHRIYLDHAATTPLAEEARIAMLPWLGESFGNASSTHAEGRRAKEAIDVVREAVSRRLGCLFGEVTFTSSGTESANLAIIGVVLANTGSRRRVLVGASDHHCVLHTKAIVERLGHHFETIPCDQFGRVAPDSLPALLDDVLVVSAMFGNNEVGSISPVASIGKRCRDSVVLFHTDASQAFPFAETGAAWSVEDLNADLTTISAHKFYGPKGVGALYVRAGTKIAPLTVGGGQEREMRAGTENVAGIAGMGAALDFMLGQPEVVDGKRASRDAFASYVAREAILTIPDGPRLPGHCHLRFPGIEADSMLIRLDRMGLSASSGAACSSGSLEPSHVLLACGFDERTATEGLRFSFGIGQSVELAEKAADLVVNVASEIRNSRPAG